MEPITLCGAVILAFGLWDEFEPILTKVAGAIFSVMPTISAPTVQRPLSVKYMTNGGR